MSSHKILYLSQSEVAGVNLEMATIIQLLEAAFANKGAGKVEMPPKPGIHTMPDAFIHAMPAYIPGLRSAGIKWVSGYPENFKRGLPYITGLLILNDVETGLPYAMMDCAWITAYRTGAATGLAAKYLARPESKVAGILACGVQGRYVREMSAQLGIEVFGVQHPRQAVEPCDLVVTSGPILKHPSPSIEKDWLQPGAFGSAVDFDSYWTPEALAQMDRISTDDHAQFQYYHSVGYFQHTPAPYADLGEIVAGLMPGRQSAAERTLAINLGLALDDMAVAPEIYRRAKEMGLGTWLEL
jgi:ornithine cyclodeaminase/alanine dehydrogenase-like protein (mu-crystallin family)